MKIIRCISGGRIDDFYRPSGATDTFFRECALSQGKRNPFREGGRKRRTKTSREAKEKEEKEEEDEKMEREGKGTVTTRESRNNA